MTESESSSETPLPASGAAAPRSGSSWRLVILGLVVILAAAGFWLYRDSLSLSALALKEAAFRDFQSRRPVLVYVVAFLIYAGATGLSLPGAAAMTLVLGWLFGFWRALVLVSFASTAGATLSFLLSRYLLTDIVERRFGDRLAAFRNALKVEGPYYLFTLRLIPAVPFFVINIVMGLTPIRLSTYWWVSQLGMLPGTAVYVYAGSTVPNLATLADRGVGGILSPKLILAFVALGLFPIAVRKLMSRFSARASR